MTSWYGERRVVASAIACAVAAALFVGSLRRALAAPGRERARAARAVGAAPAEIEQPALPRGVLTETVEHDPFHAERRRPAVAFSLPGSPAQAKPIVAPVAPAATLRLLGTVVSTAEDAFAMAQLGADPPRVVRAGAKIGGFTLRKIERGRAVFLSPDGESVDLRVSKSGP